MDSHVGLGKLHKEEIEEEIVMLALSQFVCIDTACVLKFLSRNFWRPRGEGMPRAASIAGSIVMHLARRPKSTMGDFKLIIAPGRKSPQEFWADKK